MLNRYKFYCITPEKSGYLKKEINMLFVKSLTENEQITLEAMRDYHPLSMNRYRAHSILLSSYFVAIIADMLVQ